jgi:site-specific recombinase XerD
MSLELRKGSRKFYAVIRIDGKKKAFPLKTKYQGTPPPGMRIRFRGDAEFERSKGKAEKEAEDLEEVLKEKESKVKTLKRIHRIQTGKDLETLPLSQLHAVAKDKIRSKKQSEKNLKDLELALNRFREFLEERYPGVDDAKDVTREMAEAFIRYEQASNNFTAKTINNHKGSLSAAFEAARKLERIFTNPFTGIPDLAEDIEHRRPFTIDQLTRILDVAKEDGLLYSLIVTAMTTSMRLGDCCCLKWESVQTDIQQIQVPAIRKTMKTASIPYYGLLEKVLNEAKARSPKSEYVFPEARQYYEGGMQHIFTDRFEKILLMAGFTDDDNPETSIRLSRKRGGRKASIRGFHSFKTTWVTFALMSGIPIEVIKHVTGNQVVDIVLKHYFQPGIREMRHLVRSKMPGLITDGDDPGRACAEVKLDRVQMLQMLQSMDENNWREVRAEMVKALG